LRIHETWRNSAQWQKRTRLCGYFDEVARAAIPQCWDWEVGFIELPDDIFDSGNQASANYRVLRK
jgi:hypothetical protein